MTARCFVWLYQLGGNKQAQGSHGSLEPSLEIHAPSVAQDKYSVLVLVIPPCLRDESSSWKLLRENILALDIVLLAWKLLLSRVQKVWRANTTTTICGSLVAKEECGVISLGWHAEAALRSRQKQRVNQTTTQRAARHVDGPARFLAKEIQSILALSRK